MFPETQTTIQRQESSIDPKKVAFHFGESLYEI